MYLIVCLDFSNVTSMRAVFYPKSSCVLNREVQVEMELVIDTYKILTYDILNTVFDRDLVLCRICVLVFGIKTFKIVLRCYENKSAVLIKLCAILS